MVGSKRKIPLIEAYLLMTYGEGFEVRTRSTVMYSGGHQAGEAGLAFVWKPYVVCPVYMYVQGFVVAYFLWVLVYGMYIPRSC